jgi:SAM-dependent methyltransferase
MAVTIEEDTYKLKEEIIALQRDGRLPSLDGERVLEVGPGRGFGTKLLKELGADVTAIELDENRADEGFKLGNFDGVKLLVPQDARDYQFDTSFDHVFGFHIGPLVGSNKIPQTWKDILSNSKSHVRRGGTVFLSYHCGEDTDLQEYLASVSVNGSVYPRVSHNGLADVYFQGEVGLPVNVYLIGTIHKDVRGRQRLEKILEHLRPDAITIEADKEFLKQATEIDELASWSPSKQREILGDVYGGSSITNAGLTAFLDNYLFEIRTAREYARRNGIRFVPADPTMTQVLVQQLKSASGSDVAIAKNFEQEWDALVLGANEDVLRMLSQKIDRFYSPSDKQVPPELTETRDPNYVRAIRDNAHGVVAHICGSAHLTGNYDNLPTRLSDLPHKVVLLNSADQPTIYKELHAI